MLGTGGYRYVPLMIKARMGKAQGSISRHGSPRTKLRGQEAFLGGVDLRQQVTVAKQTTGGGAWESGFERWHSPRCKWHQGLTVEATPTTCQGPRPPAPPSLWWSGLCGGLSHSALPRPGTLPYPWLGGGHLTSELQVFPFIWAQSQSSVKSR